MNVRFSGMRMRSAGNSQAVIVCVSSWRVRCIQRAVSVLQWRRCAGTMHQFLNLGNQRGPLVYSDSRQVNVKCAARFHGDADVRDSGTRGYGHPILRFRSLTE